MSSDFGLCSYKGLSAGSETDTDLYCKLCFVAGPDWSITAGQEEGITQVGKQFEVKHLHVCQSKHNYFDTSRSTIYKIQ